MNAPDRRQFLRGLALTAGGTALSGCSSSDPPFRGIVDIHQHVNYVERPDAKLVQHQELMGITRTILLPAGRSVSRPSTHDGKSNGLAAGTGGNEACHALVKAHPEKFAFFANEVTDLPEAKEELERYLKRGAIGIGEQKFGVDCDSPHVELMAEIAKEFDVPVLLHFQHGRYNLGFENFHHILEKFPGVNFIGHAQTWWGNIDRDHVQATMYPKGAVTPGGLTDRYLRDYPNMFGDLSAGSGRNALARDEDHARDFLDRHHTKLFFGSDCPDPFGKGEHCIGFNTLALLQRLVTDQRKLENILGRNARRVMRL